MQCDDWGDMGDENYPVQQVMSVEADQYLRKQLRPLATKGSASAQYLLGSRHHWGRPQHIETALLWYERAARQGHADAQFFAARCLDWGTPGPIDLPRRAEYLAMCIAQHPSRFAASEALGSMYLHDEIPTPNAETRYAEAVRLYKLDIELAKGRRQGRTDSYLQLGRCYLQGRGVPVDRSEAMRLWYHAVEEWGDPDARDELENNGMGVPLEAWQEYSFDDY